MGSAQTGTGKTAAFGLPILTKLAKHGAMRCLVLEPTRELAAQVETAFRDYSRFMDVEIGLVHGGVGFGGQRQMLKDGVDVLVATPGRLIDFMESDGLKLDSIQLYTTIFNEQTAPGGGGPRGGRTLKGYSFGSAKRRR
jgi:ATP-dependent RNA helicase RhlE